jgi:UDP-N-acetylglucosamine--N-acetylmuramyl-(pentapeptide) pyrophosphoryl-undecaprenol N-acetylglucosamine transferase
VLVSVGGYASVPPVIAASVLRVPIVVVSYDAVPGAAARLGSRLAKANAVAFEASTLPRKVVTGAPLRSAILDLDVERDRPAAREALGLPADRFVLLVVGGSLGSGALNELTASYVASHADRMDLAVRHVVGARHGDAAPPAVEQPDRLWYQVVRYEDRMHLAYAAADLVLARAGATTVAELAATGRPSILVPWPLATEDHQTANARVLADVGAAVLVPESELSVERLSAEIDRLSADPVALSAMADAARSLARPDAAARIADLAEQYARPSPGSVP